MKQYLRGETPYLETKIYSNAGILVTPTSAEVSVTDPKGKVLTAFAAMTQVGTTTGEYYYVGWTVADTSLAGVYKWICKVTDGAVITKTEGEFEVMEYGST
jgi:hypothetical protein